MILTNSSIDLSPLKVKDGKVKSIGISNFESERLEELCEAATIKPSVLQVECHPYYQQNALKKRIEKYGTVIESWYPIGHGDKGLINEDVFTKLAQKYGKSNVQIILRWHIQEGTIVFLHADIINVQRFYICQDGITNYLFVNTESVS